MLKYLFKGGSVIDGLGTVAREATVGIEGDRIRILPCDTDAEVEAYEVVNAAGMVICPGFVDVHSHSDLTVLAHPTADSKVMQGVTTEVIGNCGFGPWPSPHGTQEILGDNGEGPLTWRNFDEYFAAVEAQGASVNIAALVGHGNIRQELMGMANRRPTRDELRGMQRFISEALDDGALGLSTGLIYAPSTYADTEEIVELCKTVNEGGGIYFSHIRGESDLVESSVEEALQIGLSANVPVQISHLKVAGKRNWGKGEKICGRIEAARRRGHRVSADAYPYQYGATGLASLLPAWLHEDGKLLERLEDPETIRRVDREIQEGIPGWWNPIGSSGWDNVFVSSAKNNPDAVGKSILEIADKAGLAPLVAAVTLLIGEKGNVASQIRMMSEQDIEEIVSHPFVFAGSDSACLPRGGLHGEVPPARAFGTFPRLIREYSLNRKIITLPEAIAKMTSSPCRTLGLSKRGAVVDGYFADLVVFDPVAIQDTATQENPTSEPLGIRYVFVNGELVMKDGEHTQMRPGRALRRTSAL
jgi:N-acyl-D-amino-acid deacylase